MDFQNYQIGDVVCNPSTDETVFDLTDSGALLLLKFRNPKSNEKNDIKSGVAQIKLALQDGILFFLARFGRSNWVDAPYHRDLSSFKLQRPDSGFGIALHIMLIDAATGCLVAQRIIGLSTQFSSDLLDAMFQQPSFSSIQEYLQAIQRVYERYTTDDLVSVAISSNEI